MTQQIEDEEKVEECELNNAQVTLRTTMRLEHFALLQATEYNCSLNCSLICHSRICSVCTVAYFLSDRTSGAINQLLRHFHYFTAMISDNAVNNLYITFSFLMLSHLVEFGIYPSANVNNLESIRFGIRPVCPSLRLCANSVFHFSCKPDHVRLNL